MGCQSQGGTSLHSTTTLDQTRHRRRSLRRLATAATATAALIAPAIGLAAPAAQGAPASKASVVAMADGPYGPMLIAGSGQSAGTALYVITSDTSTSYGCTATKKAVLGMPYFC